MNPEMKKLEVSAVAALLGDRAKKKGISKGKRQHSHILRDGLIKKSPRLANPLIRMHAECGALEKLSAHEVISWNILISRHVSKGKIWEALKCFERMQSKGLTPDAFTFTSILKACGNIKDIGKGKLIHEKIISTGLLKKDVILATALIDMYARCGLLLKAREVLEELPIKDTISWNALIGGYVHGGLGEEALNCFYKMKSEGLSPNGVTYICILKACGITRSMDKGMEIHYEIASQKLLNKDVAIGNALVDMYAKCGSLAKAQYVFEELPSRDVVSWNALIAGFIQQGNSQEALRFCHGMQNEGLSPNAITFTCMLKACSQTGSIEKGKQFHDEIVSRGLLEKDIMIGSALVDMYVKCGVLEKAQQVLEELPNRNVVSWSTLIAGYAQQGQGQNALDAFHRMQSEGFTPNAITYICLLNACSSTLNIEKGEHIHKEVVHMGMLNKDVVLGNALIDMYARCGSLSKAHQVLEEIPIRNVASWNTLIAAYVKKEQFHEAVDCYQCMQHDGLCPDEISYICILKAFSSTGAVDKAVEVHKEVVNRSLFGKDIILGNTLVDMYAKSGLFVKAQQVLKDLPLRNVVSWNALMSGYVQQGLCYDAANCLKQMCREGLSPDKVTFLCVLSACNHIGLLDEAQTLFLNMSRIYGVPPTVEHHTCMVAGYACAGHFDKALSVIQVIPCFDCAVWLALLVACHKWGNVKLGMLTFDQICQLYISCAPAYTLMTNMFTAAGMQDDARKMEATRMKQLR